MATIKYPDDLPDFKMGKSRRLTPSYYVTQPLQGMPYTSMQTDDEVPVIWEVEIICKNLYESSHFRDFVKSVSHGQRFDKPILTEFGYINHECLFVEMPLEPTALGPNQYSYSGVIQAVELLEA